MILFGCLIPALADGAPPFRAEFEGEAALDGWGGSEGHTVTGYEGTQSLLIENTDGTGSATVCCVSSCASP